MKKKRLSWGERNIQKAFLEHRDELRKTADTFDNKLGAHEIGFFFPVPSPHDWPLPPAKVIVDGETREFLRLEARFFREGKQQTNKNIETRSIPIP